jgi:two-component system chemotaxis sensor kinase CheA
VDDFELEIKKTFLEESEGLLVEAENAFMALDGGEFNEEVISKLFRAAHSFKGGARAVGFIQLADFAHKLEDAINLLKTREIEATRKVCTLFLESMDVLKIYVEGLKRDLNFTHDSSSTEAKLKDIRNLKDSSDNSKTEDESNGAVVNAPKNTPAVPSVKSANKGDDEGIRVGLKKLDELLNIVGELVVNQSMMTQHRVGETLNTQHSKQTLSYLDKLVNEIQHVSLSLRMLPLKPTFQKMRRIVRDVSSSLDRDVEFIAEGEEVELDKTIIDQIVDPLTHMVRNAVDHGIENKEERLASGKNPQAKVWLKAIQQEDRIAIIIKDDGKGLDRNKLLKKAIEKGIVKEGAEMQDSEIYNLIFAAGFSTKEVVTDFSGRGVGMDVVRKAIEDLKGNVQIKTELGKGTEFIISLPLSLSIISGMVISVDARKYVVPVTQLVETIEYRKLNIESTQGKGRMVYLRGEVMPVMSLSHILHSTRVKTDADTKQKLGLVAISNGKKVSFEIDEILGQQQIVLKKLGSEIQGVPGLVAGAILANGEPGMVISLYDFISKMGGGRNAAA